MRGWVLFGISPSRFPMSARRSLGLLLAIHTLLLGSGAWIHSPSFDEWGHLPAGISHWHYGHFDLYRVNPPLVRMIAAVPVLFCGPKIERAAMSAHPYARHEFRLAQDMVAKHGEQVFWWFTLARWACLPFSLLGAWICFRWASELYGSGSGLTAAALWCFSPTVLAHGQMITPDVGSAAVGAAAGYLFWRWLRAPTFSSAFAAGVVLGLAQLTKFTWVILFGLWPLLWLVWRVAGHREDAVPRPGATQTHGALPDRGGPRWRREAEQVALMLLLAVYVINLGYGFEGTGRRLGDLQFVSRTLRTRPGAEVAAGTRIGNRFAGTLWGRMPIPVPVNYIAGIDRQKYDFEAGFWSYFRGQWRRGGWWYYYLYGLAIKEPLGTGLLALLAAAAGVALGGGGAASWRDELLLLTPVVAVLVLVSSQTGFNHHLRYVLPMYPLAFIWISRAARRGVRRAPVYRLLVVAALAWSAGSSLRHYPHSLSYFNELVGGPRYGHDHLLDSNIDWGQDLLLLKRWVECHPEAQPLGVAYSLPSSIISLEQAGLPAVDVPAGPPRDGGAAPAPELTGPLPGWYAIFVRELRERHGRYEYFRRFEPVATIGYTVYIYRITADEANRVRRELGLPPIRAEEGS